MGTIVNYAERQTASFAEVPFSDADSIALAQLSYYHLTQASMDSQTAAHTDAPAAAGAQTQADAGNMNIAATPRLATTLITSPLEIGDLLRRAKAEDIAGGGTYQPENVALLTALTKNPRFCHIRISNIVEPAEPANPQRFAACCFDLGDGTLYIAFRGTDDTTAAWHEDFEMAFLMPVESQKLALAYTESALQSWHGSVILGGHSKGGNLAIYAAARLPKPLQKRIRAVYSHDGPGFSKHFINSAGFQRIRPLIRKTVPEQSIIGGLFESGVSSTVVTSSAKGIWQHLTVTWQFDDDARLITTGTPIRAAQYFSQTLNQWMASCTPAERRAFINDFFAAFAASGYVTFSEISAHWTEALPRMLDLIRSLPAEERANMTAVLKSFAQVAVSGAVANAVAELPNAMPSLPFVGKLGSAARSEADNAASAGEAAHFMN